MLSKIPKDAVDCLALGGGYGRGEGGVLHQGAAERPFNDYDLVLIHHYDEGIVRALLEAVHREATARCGIHVDVTPIHINRVKKLPQALTWYEFGKGHK